MRACTSARAGMETLSFHGVLGGALSDHALPPQFQRAHGGSGSLPGYALFSGSSAQDVVRTDVYTVHGKATT